jgi:hypothetical protein
VQREQPAVAADDEAAREREDAAERRAARVDVGEHLLELERLEDADLAGGGAREHALVV